MMKGKVIAITRSKEDSEEFTRLISTAKAKAISLPTIELVSKGEGMVDEFLNAVKTNDPDYSVFMSSKAVKLLFDTAKKISKYEKLQLSVANTTVIAVGPKTKTALESEGIRVAHVPERFSSVGVGEVFSFLNAEGKKVIVPRSGASTPFLKQLLEKIGLKVKEVYLYDVKSSSALSYWVEFKELFSQNKVDGIIFTSASSVRAFFDIMLSDSDEPTLKNNLKKTTIIAIGPFTADELQKFGVKPITSDVHTVSGAVESIKSYFTK
ncbi:MAG TPA: uroporphyrinogen-III synthase [Candidatus Nitrosotalea sp.]|nr:uroporphyrinogen-III synthase [Candidatus Nitrosotalea sp.]